VTGQNYTLERNDDLSLTNWVYVTNLTGNGAIQRFEVPLAPVPQRFFRLRSGASSP